MGKFALMRSTNWRMKTKQTIKLRVLNLYFVEHLYKIYRKFSVCVGKGLTLDNLVVQHFVFFDFTVVVVAFLSFFWLIGHNQPKQQKSYFTKSLRWFNQNEDEEDEDHPRDLFFSFSSSSFKELRNWN